MAAAAQAAETTAVDPPRKRHLQAPSTRTVIAQVQSEKLVSDRRERIINAAISVFHSKGFHNATTADIAREAGLTQSNIYNYVKSKQDVLFLVCKHLVGMYDDILDEIREQYQDTYLRLAKSITAILEVMAEYRDELQLLYNETHSLERADRLVILSQISGFIGRFETLIADYEEATGTTVLENRRLAANLLSFVPAIVALRSWDLRHYESKDSERLILSFLLKGMGIPDPADAKPARTPRAKGVVRRRQRS